jgi:hypothetical protein
MRIRIVPDLLGFVNNVLYFTLPAERRTAVLAVRCKNFIQVEWRSKRTTWHENGARTARIIGPSRAIVR